MKQLRKKVKSNGMLKLAVMAVALLQTVSLFFVSLEGTAATVWVILTGTLVFGLYYLSDGLSLFFSALLSIAEKVGCVLGFPMILFASLFGLGRPMRYLVVAGSIPMTFMCGLILAYCFPVVGVPLLYVMAKKLYREDSAKDVTVRGEQALYKNREKRAVVLSQPADTRAQRNSDNQEVDWGRVYNRVMDELER